MPGGYHLGLRLLRSQGRVANFFIRQPRRSATGQALVAQKEPSRNTSAAAAAARVGLSTATAPAPAPAPARLTAHQSGILVHRKGKMVRIQQCASDLDTSDYQTPHPRLMRGCIQVRYAFQILRYATAVHPESRQHFCPGEVLS
jgi:hypothetical protein